MANDNFDLDATMIPDNFGISSTEILSDEALSDFVLGDSTTIDTIKPDQTPKDKEKQDNLEEKTESQKRKELELEVSQSFEDDILEDKGVTPKTKEIEDKENEEEDDEDDNTFDILSKNLFELGIFNKEEDEEDVKISTPEEFRDRFVKEVTTQANSQIYNFLVDKHGEQGLEMFNSIFVKGVSPQDYLSKFTQIESLKELDITDESVQERVYKTYYKRLGWAEDKIDKKIQKLKDYAELEEEATTIHEKLIEQEVKDLESQKIAKESEEKAKMQAQVAYAQAVNQIIAERLKTKDFDGIPLTDKTAKDAYDNLVVEKYKLPSGEKLTEFDKTILELRRPENYEKKVKLWLLLQNDLDLTKIKTKAVSEKNDKLFNNLTVKDKVNKRTNPVSNSRFSDIL